MNQLRYMEMAGRKSASVRDIMRWTGIKSSQAVFYRARKGDFRRCGKDGRETLFALDDTARNTIMAMAASRVKRAGRPASKR